MIRLGCLVAAFLVVLCCLPMMGESTSDGGEVTSARAGRRIIVVDAGGGGDYTSIRIALSNADPGDTIYVNAGRYNERDLAITIPVDLIGESNENTIIESTVTVRSDHVNISNFYVCGYYGNRGISLENADYVCVHNITAAPRLESGIYGSNSNNCTFTMNRCNCGEQYERYTDQYGICLINCNDCIITHNECNGHGEDYYSGWGATGHGIYIFRSNRNKINNNTCNDNVGVDGSCEGHGIRVHSSRMNIIENNILDHTEGSSVLLESSSRNVIRNNVCNESWAGITLRKADKNFLQNNTYLRWISVEENSNNNIICNHDSKIGLSWNVDNNSILYNSIETNTWNSYYRGNNTIFHHNNFIKQDGQYEISDDGINNTWHDGNGEGNYWSDYEEKYLGATNDGKVWNTPYEIAGTANSSDPYPLVEPVDIRTPVDFESIEADAGGDVTIEQHESVQFRASNSSDVLYPIVNYSWSFFYNGSNITLFGNEPEFMFHSAGAYVITLTVVNSRGHTDDDTVIVTVLDTEPPVAHAGNDDVIDQGICYQFNGSASRDNLGIVNYTWNFTYDQEDIYLYGCSPCVIFDDVGMYNVTLKISDERGFGAIDHVLLTVRDSTSPIAQPGNDILVDQHEIAHFNGRYSSDNVAIVNYTWSFTYRQEPVFLYGVETEFRFDDVAQYAVVLNVTDAEGNWNTEILNITVLDITPPIADAGPDIRINQGEYVEFFFHQKSTDNTAIKNWTWTFTYDGSDQLLYHSIEMSSLPIFTFDIPGIYNITMTVTDESGNSATDSLNVTVLDTEAPVVQLNGRMKTAVNSTVYLRGANCTDNVGIVNWTWTFTYGGNEVTLYGETVSFRFGTAGNYTVRLTVTDAAGRSAWGTMAVMVGSGETGGGDDDGGGGDGDGTKGDGGMGYVWAGIAVACVVVVLVIVVMHVVVRRKKEDARLREEDELGRVEGMKEKSE